MLQLFADRMWEPRFLEVKGVLSTKKDCEGVLRDLETKALRFRWNREKENYGVTAKKSA
jgi:hypothetical protein